MIFALSREKVYFFSGRGEGPEKIKKSDAHRSVPAEMWSGWVHILKIRVTKLIIDPIVLRTKKCHGHRKNKEK